MHLVHPPLDRPELRHLVDELRGAPGSGLLDRRLTRFER